MGSCASEFKFTSDIGFRILIQDQTNLPPLAFSIMALEETLVVGDTILAENKPWKKNKDVSMDEVWPDTQLAGGWRQQRMRDRTKWATRQNCCKKDRLTYPANLGRVRDTIVTKFIPRAIRDIVQWGGMNGWQMMEVVNNIGGGINLLTTSIT